MSRPVFSFRPRMEDPAHKRAWEILQRVPEGQKNAFLVQGILQMEDTAYLEKRIRQIVREELKGLQAAQGETDEVSGDILPQMLDFLSSMEEMP